MAIYDKLGVRQLAEAAIAKYNAMAIDALQQIGISKEAKDAFLALIEKLVGRNK